jgi:large subunit ribosomal protein L15
MPLTRRLPKRGFNNVFAKKYAEINVSQLNVFENGATVDFAALLKKGLVQKYLDGVRILGKGDLKVKVNVKANGITASAKEKIEAAGGKAEVI